MCDALRGLFRLIHQRDKMAKALFGALLQAARDEVLPAGTQDVPSSRYAAALAKRLQTYGQSYFT